MLCARSRRQPVLRVLILFGLGSVWAVACGGPQPLRGAGSVCFRADDCQAGLACVPETADSAKRVCSADLSGIVAMVDGAAPEAGDMPEAMAGAPATPQGGSPASAGAPGEADKPAAGGAPSAAGGASASGGAGEAASAGTTAAGGAASAGAPSAGSSSGGADNGGASAGTGG